MSSSNHIEQLFTACDLDGSGYIDQTELAHICPHLGATQISEIFKQLDDNGDGLISVVEFREGFANLAAAGEQQVTQQVPDEQVEAGDLGDSRSPARSSKRYGRRSRRLEEQKEESVQHDDFVHALSGLDQGFSNLSCQEQVCEIYQALHSTSSNQPILQQFETLVVNIIRDIKAQQEENARLEQSFKREKDTYQTHLRELEEELDTQLKRAEERARNEEREKAEQLQAATRAELEAEMAEMQSNLRKLQTIETQVSQNESEGLETREKLDEMCHENRSLRSTLTDAQTGLVLLRSELASLKQRHDDKCQELDSEKLTMEEFQKEQDNLTRQLHMLHEANKKLHDTNDDLRSAMERQRENLMKRPQVVRPVPRVVSSPGVDRVMDYVASTPVPRMRGTSSLADELSKVTSPVQHETSEMDSLPDDFDSGHSTYRGDHQDAESDNSIEEERESRSRGIRPIRTVDHEYRDFPDDVDHLIEEEDEEDDLCLSRPLSRASSRASSKLSRSSRNSARRARPLPVRRLPPPPAVRQ